jgi:lipoyl(octanoyl) transferase
MTALVIDLGRRGYGEVWELQKKLVGMRASGKIPNTLILVEHDHVITLGRRTTQENFKPQDVPVFTVERGGDATYHGPGQLVGYPIMRFEELDVKKYLRQLESILIAAVSKFSIEAERKENHTGVWVGEKKLASIGVAIANWVTYHGFALNVNTDLKYFQLIKPCGLDPNTITSMKEVLGRDLEFQDVKREVLRSFGETFGEELEQGDLDALTRMNAPSP